MQEQATAATSSWRRWLGKRIAIGAIAGTVIMAAYSGLAPTFEQLRRVMTRLTIRDTGSFDGSPWIMGLTLWLLAVITGAILWGIARQVLKNAADPDQREGLTAEVGIDRVDRHRTWDF